MRGFSRRTGWDTSGASLAAAARTARAAGRDVIDLTISNPTLCGFDYDSEGIIAALADPASMIYDADPMGMRSAREAVCGYYADHGAPIDPAQVLLTTSTSEAYGFLFRLLCDPADEVLVPQPGYPLFDLLADLEDVRLKTYPLFWDFGWWIDFTELERNIGPRTRAILVVHPANPTGHWTRHAERARLEEICARRGLTLIVDEVFLDYPVSGEPEMTFAAHSPDCLLFVLSGLSKVAALPQMKVAWCVALGPANLRDQALGRLEVIADTFLSMGAPAQRALPSWLEGRHSIQRQIRARVRENLRAVPLAHLAVEAGWTAVLILPHGRTAESLLEEFAVVVHPGKYYGLAGPGRAVISLLAPPGELRSALGRLEAASQNLSG